MRIVPKLMASVLLVGTLGVSAPACIVATPDPVLEVDAEPPAAQVEVVPAERPGYVWIHGYWQRFGSQWRWHAGYWEGARSGYAWRDGYWDRRGNRSVWVPGHWEGGAAVPNNNPGVVVHDHSHDAPPPQREQPGVVVHDHSHP